MTAQKAYKSGDAALVRRIAVLLDVSRGDTPDTIAAKHGVSVSSNYAWLKHLLTKGLTSLKPHWRGGRPRKLTPSQRQGLSDWLKAGPQTASYPCGCWSALVVQDLIQREFGVLYKVHYVCELLNNLGVVRRELTLLKNR